MDLPGVILAKLTTERKF